MKELLGKNLGMQTLKEIMSGFGEKMHFKIFCFHYLKVLDCHMAMNATQQQKKY